MKGSSSTNTIVIDMEVEMNMNMLFVTLSNVEVEMDRAELSADAHTLNILDERYDAAWKDIMDHDPADGEAAEEMLARLLDKMCCLAEEGSSVSQVREKILDLYQRRTTAATMPRRVIDIELANPSHV